MAPRSLRGSLSFLTLSLSETLTVMSVSWGTALAVALGAAMLSVMVRVRGGAGCLKVEEELPV